MGLFQLLRRDGIPVVQHHGVWQGHHRTSHGSRNRGTWSHCMWHRRRTFGDLVRGLCVCCTVAAVVFCVHGLHRSLPLPSKSGILKCPTNATTMYAREYRARVVLCVRMRACFHLIVYFAVAATTSSPWLGTAKKWWMACWRSTG